MFLINVQEQLDDLFLTIIVPNIINITSDGSNVRILMN
jgi:hypothetical protein